MVPGVFRLKVQDLDPGAGLFRLYVTDICRRSWLEHPAGAVGDTSGFAGLPTPGVGWDSLGMGCIDLDTFVELTGMATAWLGDVCAALLTQHPWRLFCVHLHAIDSFYHLCSAKLDERLTPDPAERRRYEVAERAIYRQLDDAVGRMLEAADASALTVLVSDHGAKPAGERVPLRRILADAGLLAEQTGGDAAGAAGPADIDWEQTLAAPQGQLLRARQPRRSRPARRRSADRFRGRAPARDPRDARVQGSAHRSVPVQSRRPRGGGRRPGAVRRRRRRHRLRRPRGLRRRARADPAPGDPRRGRLGHALALRVLRRRHQPRGA